MEKDVLEIKDAIISLKVGDSVITNGAGHDKRREWLTGIVGEISKEKQEFYVWQNELEGEEGELSPSTLGFKHSWAIAFESIGEIIINKKEETKRKMKETKGMHLSLEKAKNKLILGIQIPPEMEEFFKTISSGEERESTYWKLSSDNSGAKFYVSSPKYTELESKLLTSHNFFNDFGGQLYRDGSRINIAPLRAIGASVEGGVKIESDRFLETTNIDFEYYLKELGRAAKKIYEVFISDKKVTAVISFEL